MAPQCPVPFSAQQVFGPALHPAELPELLQGPACARPEQDQGVAGPQSSWADGGGRLVQY